MREVQVLQEGVLYPSYNTPYAKWSLKELTHKCLSGTRDEAETDWK